MLFIKNEVRFPQGVIKKTSDHVEWKFEGSWFLVFGLGISKGCGVCIVLNTILWNFQG